MELGPCAQEPSLISCLEQGSLLEVGGLQSCILYFIFSCYESPGILILIVDGFWSCLLSSPDRGLPQPLSRIGGGSSHGHLAFSYPQVGVEGKARDWIFCGCPFSLTCLRVFSKELCRHGSRVSPSSSLDEKKKSELGLLHVKVFYIHDSPRVGPTPDAPKLPNMGF
ncbi:hypothetical protein mRhiFer1_008260 [Rhinolophus ferrumequinum]|uniref:Uncharacterized protein n=1 Tax=Rhinolophus ferrumequinum TaxID=59479 RepID=A0A7J7VQV9_RHIFE|nr:hypothetical protein mRhiFer1_008260 [Rhinolophus ferrumequinum]